MRRYACALFLAVLPLPGMAAENPSALKALKLLPKTEMQSLARIEAHDGTPVPERWHFLIHDPNTESGLKEYVVAAGELVAARSVSQFAERLAEADVIEGKALRVDTDMLAELAKNYAAVNDVAIDRISYQLFKNGGEAQPLWKLSCLDQAGQTIGTLVVTAAKGNVVSHDGFTVAPKVGPNHAALDFETAAEPVVATESKKPSASEVEGKPRRDVASIASGPTKPKSGATAQKRSSSKKRPASATRRTSRQRETRDAPSQPVIVRKATRPIRNVLRNLFQFR
jgi:hypothetical protein